MNLFGAASGQFNNENTAVDVEGMEGFDARFYMMSYPDLLNIKSTPLNHFLSIGWKEGRNPSSEFDTTFYRSAVSGATHSELCPLIHFNTIGKKLGAPRTQSEMLSRGRYNPPAMDICKALPGLLEDFDESYYLRRYQETPNGGMSGLERYLSEGWLSNKAPSEKFDPFFYRDTFQNNDNSDICPLIHFHLYGKKLGFPVNFAEALKRKEFFLNAENSRKLLQDINNLDRESAFVLTAPYFNSTYYLKNNPDVSKSGMDPRWHYFEFGWKEGRNPSELFDVKWYKDIVGSNFSESCNLLVHYAVIGRVNQFDCSEQMTFLRMKKAGEALFSDHFHYLLGKLGFNLNDYKKLDYIERYILPIFSVQETRKRHNLGPQISDVEVFFRYLLLDFPQGIPPSSFFSETLYLAELARMHIVSPGLDESTFHHWLLKGVDAGISPTPALRLDEYLKLNPDLEGYQPSLIEHYLNHGQYEGRRFNLIATVAEPTKNGWLDRGVTRSRKFCEMANSDVEFGNYFKYARDFISSGRLAKAVESCNKLEPEIGKIAEFPKSYLPPWHDQAWVDFEKILNAIPVDHFDTIILIPHCKLGGADYLAGMLTSYMGQKGSTLVIRTDQSDWVRGDWFPANVSTFDLSKFFGEVSQSLRMKMLYTILIYKRPSAIFNVNSRLAFDTFAVYGERLALFMRLYAYYFCADRTKDGLEVGYPVTHFANILPHLYYAMVDNRYLAEQLIGRYGLQGNLKNKVQVIYSPSLSTWSHQAIAELQFDRGEMKEHRKRILWAGRLDIQKRFDLVIEIAQQLPQIDFDCWGSYVLDVPPDELRLPPNLFLHPPFRDYEELPLNQSDGWLFTSAWEGMPTLLIELASMGVPIVASGVGGVPELINESTGWLVAKDATVADYVSALLEMVSSPQERMLRGKELQRLASVQHDPKSFNSSMANLLL